MASKTSAAEGFTQALRDKILAMTSEPAIKAVSVSRDFNAVDEITWRVVLQLDRPANNAAFWDVSQLHKLRADVRGIIAQTAAEQDFEIEGFPVVDTIAATSAARDDETAEPDAPEKDESGS